MLSPSESRTNRIARLVIRTQAVPIAVSANGSAASATATRTSPIHAAAGCPFMSTSDFMPVAALRAVGDARAQQPGGPEDEHGDQHQEREHVLIVAAEERQVWIADAALG